MLTPATALAQVATGAPTTPVLVVPPPDPGSVNQIYTTWTLNGDASTRIVNLYLSDGVKQVNLFTESLGWTASLRYPQEDRNRPFYQVPGWGLYLVTDGWGGVGLSPQITVDYAIDTGMGDVPSDYKWTYVESPAVVLTPIDLLPAPDSYKARLVSHISIHNDDSGGTPNHSFFLLKTNGVLTNWMTYTASLTPNKWSSILSAGMKPIITSDESLQIMMGGHAECTAPSLIGVSYMEVGGVPIVVHSDIGPWDRWPPTTVLHAKSVDFDGSSERLETYASAQLLGIANAFTVACWVKPKGNTTNTQWVFMHGQGSNTNRIHLYRDTQETGEPWRIHIRDAGGNEKDYRFGPNLALDAWYHIACTWDGTDLICYVDGAAVTPSELVVDDSGASVPVMADSSRQMSFGGISALADTDGFEGRGHSAGSWSSVLTADEIAYLFYHPGMDWRVDEGDYASKADNEHYYLAGKHGTPDIGHDYGLGSNTFDLATETGITDVDIVDDAPGV